MSVFHVYLRPTLPKGRQNLHKTRINSKSTILKTHTYVYNIKKATLAYELYKNRYKFRYSSYGTNIYNAAFLTLKQFAAFAYIFLINAIGEWIDVIRS